MFRKKKRTTEPKKKKSKLREWIDAIIWAGIAAIIIRGLVMEAYKIPSSSMRHSLLEGDYLFVSKMHWGARMPITPLAVPFTHQKIPGLNIKSYLDWIHLPYFRLPGFQKIKNGNIVVFNWPADTTDNRPTDQKTNYIKRCIAIPGDSLQIINDQVYINRKPQGDPPKGQHLYIVKTNGVDFNPKKLDDMDITEWGLGGQNIYSMMLTYQSYEKIKGWSNVTGIQPYMEPENSANPNMFPHADGYSFNVSNFGPVYVPKENSTVALTLETLPLYRRIIAVYEKHNLEIKDGKIFIDGSEAHSYTFKMDYYFMMGDNRNNSEDSRFWGFVPEDHITGKAWFIFFSKDPRKSIFEGGIRFSRLLKGIK